MTYSSSHRKFSTGLLAFCCCLLMAASATRAQEAQPSAEPNERVKALEERIAVLEKEKQKAELEKDIATAQSARVRALLPTPSATPLEGKVDIDEHVKLESEILTYKALSELMAAVSARIGGVNPRPVSIVIYNDKEIAALQSYNTLKTQLDATKARYTLLLPQGGDEAGPAAALLAPEIASTLLRSAVDVAALFRTNTTINGMTFTVEEAALVSQLSKNLRSQNINVFYPSVYPPNLFSDDTPEIIKSLGELYADKTKAELIVSRCESTDNEIKALCNASKDAVLRLKALNQQVSKFIDDLSVVDETTKTSALTGMVRAENMRTVVIRDRSNILQIKTLDAAGSNKRTTNLFTGTKLSHSGGVIVNFILFNPNGEIKLADTLYNYKGFIRVKSENGSLISNLAP